MSTPLPDFGRLALLRTETSHLKVYHMSAFRFIVGLTLPILVAACDDRPSTEPTSTSDAASPGATSSYSAAGKVTKITGQRVTIAHGPVEGLGWPAMTMTFRATKPEIIAGLKAGDPVSFEFRKAGADYDLTSLSRSQ